MWTTNLNGGFPDIFEDIIHPTCYIYRAHATTPCWQNLKWWPFCDFLKLNNLEFVTKKGGKKKKSLHASLNSTRPLPDLSVTKVGDKIDTSEQCRGQDQSCSWLFLVLVLILGLELCTKSMGLSFLCVVLSFVQSLWDFHFCAWSWALYKVYGTFIFVPGLDLGTAIFCQRSQHRMKHVFGECSMFQWLILSWNIGILESFTTYFNVLKDFALGAKIRCWYCSFYKIFVENHHEMCSLTNSQIKVCVFVCVCVCGGGGGFE